MLLSAFSVIRVFTASSRDDERASHYDRFVNLAAIRAFNTISCRLILENVVFSSFYIYGFVV